MTVLFFSQALMTKAMAFESCHAPPNEDFTHTKERLSKKLLLAGLRYAREHSHPLTGFVEDTVANEGELPKSDRVRASISSTGFMMALVANLYSKGMVSREEAYSYCQRPLDAVIRKKKLDADALAARTRSGAPDPLTDISYQGWLSHFVDWATGDRWIDANTHIGVEYATTDTTWFLAGGIVCADTFPHSAVSKKFQRIFSAVNFYDFMTDGKTNKEKRTLSMAFTPGTGYSAAQWKIYQHSWLVYLLGMGVKNPDFRLPDESWSAWDRTGINLDGRILYGDRRALFSHYFPDVFMPPQEIKEACQIDYFKNSQDATLFNRDMAAKNKSSKTFLEGLWGLDAGPNPVTSKLKFGDVLKVGELNTNTYGVNSPYKQNGTACPACAVATAMFEPDVVFRDLKKWCNNPHFGKKIWGKYGPVNGINLDYGWVSPLALSGIVGPMALSVANLDSQHSVWDAFVKYGAVKRGLIAAARAARPSKGCLMPE